MIYLDYASATPLDPEVRQVMEAYESDKFYNPSANYLAAQSVRKDLEAARVKVAAQLGAKPAEITFTAGATEANNLAVRGLMEKYPEGNVVVSAIEHDSVLEPAKKYQHKIAPVTGQGIVDLAKLEKLIDEQTILVSVIYVNNELGTLQPLREIAQILNKLSKSRKSKLPLYLHTDAAQAGNHFSLQASRLGVDLMTINGGKLYGPKQSGALIIKAGIELEPQITGGGQERGLRSGTENVAGSIGLAVALEKSQALRAEQSERVRELRAEFINGLPSQAVVNGSPKHQSPHLVSVTFPGVDNERLMMQLDEAGIQVATGSACSASSDEPSHVLSAIGLKEAAVRSTLRFSFGRSTAKADISKTLDELSRLT